MVEVRKVLKIAEDWFTVNEFSIDWYYEVEGEIQGHLSLSPHDWMAVLYFWCSEYVEVLEREFEKLSRELEVIENAPDELKARQAAYYTERCIRLQRELNKVHESAEKIKRLMSALEAFLRETDDGRELIEQLKRTDDVLVELEGGDEDE